MNFWKQTRKLFATQKRTCCKSIFSLLLITTVLFSNFSTVSAAENTDVVTGSALTDVVTGSALNAETTETSIPSVVSNSSNALWVDTNPSVSSEIDLVKWYTKSSENKYYLFLPANVDLSNLVIYHSFSSTPYVNGTALNNGETTSVFANGGNFTVNVGSSSYSLVVMHSKSASMFITTESGSLSYVNAVKGNEESGNVLIVDKSGKSTSVGLDSIKGRGNSSWEASQKLFGKYPYNIKLSSKTNVLGMGKSKKWCLLANCFDQSLIRNKYIFDLSTEAGMTVTPACESIDLYANNRYIGTYLITEKVEIGNNRVEINDLEGNTSTANGGADLSTYSRGGSTSGVTAGTSKYINIPNNPEDITGGYLLEFELDERYPDEISGFVTSKRQPVIIKEPEYASKEQTTYISSYVQDMEDAIYSSSGYNSKGKYYTEYMDITSAAKAYVVQELTMNPDAVATSFYMYKDTNDIIKFGPVWDFDWALGGRSDVLNTSSLYVQNKNIYHGSYLNMMAKLCAHDDFMEEVAKVWKNDFYPALQASLGNTTNTFSLIQTLDSYYNNTKDSAAMNFKRWDMLGDTSWGSADTGSTYSANITYLKNFVSKRVAYLNTQFVSAGEPTTVYFDNSISKWSNVYAYIWTEGSVAAKVLAATQVTDNIYKISVPGKYKDIIFKNTDGITSWNLQTVNLSVPTSTSNCYKPNGTGTKPSGSWYAYSEGPAALTVDSFTTSLTSPQSIGKTITINASAKGGKDTTYSYQIAINGTVVSTTNSYTWTPSEIGTYTLSVTVTNASGETATKTMEYVIKNVSKNIVTIYYKNTSYTKAYIHYRIGSGVWTTIPGAAMTTSSTMSGYYEYTVDLGEDTTLTACFNNGSNTWDNNSNKNYTFGVGSFAVYNGTITEVTPTHVSIQNLNTNLASPQLVNTNIALSTAVSNANGAVNYTYTVTTNGTTTTLYEGSNSSVTWAPVNAGTYTLTVTAKDSIGSDSKSITYTICNPLSLDNFSVSPSSPATVDTPITLTAASTDGLGTVTYTFSVNDTTVYSGAQNTATWTPSEAGIYTLTVSAVDETAIVQTKTLNYTITEKPFEVSDITTNLASPQEIGKTITFSAKASGEGAPYNYNYVVTNESNEITASGTASSTFNWTPTEIGTYNIALTVTNSLGESIVKELSYTIKEVNKNIITIYYKNTSYSKAYIHYRIGSGAWTTAPGAAMTASSTMSGYYEYSIDLGDASTLTACFNNGSGSWDNNSNQNYSFASAGTYTVYNGTITDISEKELAVSTFNASTADSQYIGSSVTLSATAAYGSGNYTYQFVAIKDGVVTILSDYSPSSSITWTPSELGNYTLTVYAKDGTGTIANKSMSYTIVEKPSNTVTIYYNKYTNPYIHYRIGSGLWTTVPGVAMTASSTLSGYYQITIDLGENTTLTACFNNGYGTWDNNSNQNYSFTAGTYKYVSGSFTKIN